MIALLNQNTELNKDSVSKLASEIINQVNDGHLDPLRTGVKLEFLLQIVETALADIRGQMTEQLLMTEKESRAGITVEGVTVRLKETGVKYDYSNSELWAAKNVELESLKSEMKAIETQLKGITRPQTILDESTGELIKLFPPLRSSKTSVEITLPKK